MVIYSIGNHSVEKQVFAMNADGTGEPIELTASFNGGEFINFDCDPTSGRIVFNDLETNPNIYVLEYEMDEGLSITGTAEQITTDSTFRRPRWVKR